MPRRQIDKLTALRNIYDEMEFEDKYPGLEKNG